MEYCFKNHLTITAENEDASSKAKPVIQSQILNPSRHKTTTDVTTTKGDTK
jgi:hypothetical protein